MQRSREPEAKAVEPTDAVVSEQGLTPEENEKLTLALSRLSAKQFKACRLDAAGVDVSTMANLVGVVPQTISSWRKDSFYLDVRNIFISVVNRYGIKFRQDCQRLVMAPAYAELIQRMNNGRYVKAMEFKDILALIRTIGKETRLDQAVGGLTENDEDLNDLMERRKNFSVAQQAQAVTELFNSGKIIAFPVGSNVNRTTSIANVG